MVLPNFPARVSGLLDWSSGHDGSFSKDRPAPVTVPLSFIKLVVYGSTYNMPFPELGSGHTRGQNGRANSRH